MPHTNPVTREQLIPLADKASEAESRTPFDFRVLPEDVGPGFVAPRTQTHPNVWEDVWEHPDGRHISIRVTRQASERVALMCLVDMLAWSSVPYVWGPDDVGNVCIKLPESNNGNHIGSASAFTRGPFYIVLAMYHGDMNTIEVARRIDARLTALLRHG